MTWYVVWISNATCRYSRSISARPMRLRVGCCMLPLFAAFPAMRQMATACRALSSATIQHGLPNTLKRMPKFGADHTTPRRNAAMRDASLHLTCPPPHHSLRPSLLDSDIVFAV